jgi:hypothetical protein
MDCLYKGIAASMQNKMTCFVLAKHSHKAPEGLFCMKMWGCQYVGRCPLEVKMIVNCAGETNTYSIILTFGSPVVNL